MILKKLKEKLRTLRSLAARVRKVENAQKSITALQQEVQWCKAKIKRLENEPIHVIFVCHNPSLWGKLSPVFRSLKADSDFLVSVVAVPYRHESFGDKKFHDKGMAEFLFSFEGIEAISGFDQSKNEWLQLEDLRPDFVFFQTPYDSQFPFCYTSEYVSQFAKLCYVPYYGTLLYEGEVESITHPIGFFKNVSLAFLSHQWEQEDLLSRFKGIARQNQGVVVGSPMLDYVYDSKPPESGRWNLDRDKDTVRIIWTPRWRTIEGNCHFFDYKDYFVQLFSGQTNIDFLFRPHPLCLQNFLTTGELSQKSHDSLLNSFANAENASIDQSGDYQDTFRSGDIMVSDMSSIMLEFFASGNPVVYTHRVDTFNKFGREIAKGFYWVRNQAELDQVLSDLRKGKDPLLKTRQQLIDKHLLVSDGGSAKLIKKHLKSRFLTNPQTTS